VPSSLSVNPSWKIAFTNYNRETLKSQQAPATVDKSLVTHTTYAFYKIHITTTLSKQPEVNNTKEMSRIQAIRTEMPARDKYGQLQLNSTQLNEQLSTSIYGRK